MPKKYQQIDFLHRAKQKHKEKFDYSNTIYNGMDKKINVRCKKHDIEFLIEASSHVRGNGGCHKCWEDGKRITQSQFIEKANLLHNNRFDYSKTVYVDFRTKVEIICKTHGSFWQMPESHISPRANGCQSCNKSRGEIKIEEFLTHYKIQFEHNKTYPDLITSRGRIPKV